MSPPPPHHQIEHLEDFTQHEWCNNLLSDPSVTNIQKRHVTPLQRQAISNSFFTKTLFTDSAVRAFLSMYKPGRGRAQSTADAEASGDALLGNDTTSGDTPGNDNRRERTYDEANPDGPEGLILVSLGSDVDGGIGRLHGGVTATLLDQVLGITISHAHRTSSATAELTVKYKKPIMTPIVLLCRARIVREAGRWIELVGYIEDGEGTVYAEGRGAFVKNKPVSSGVKSAEKARI